MKNLKALYENLLEYKQLTFEEYVEIVGPVIPSQVLFKLESCEDDTGFLLRSFDGTYHIWFIGKVTSPLYEGERYVTVETGTFQPNQLDAAMKDLMLQMCIDCEGLIEREGVKA